MAFVSQTLGRLRALLLRLGFGFGLCTAGKDSPALGAHTVPDPPTPSPAREYELPVSPEMMEAWLVLARLRRARRAAQGQQSLDSQALAEAGR